MSSTPPQRLLVGMATKTKAIFSGPRRNWQDTSTAIFETKWQDCETLLYHKSHPPSNYPSCPLLTPSTPTSPHWIMNLSTNYPALSTKYIGVLIHFVYKTAKVKRTYQPDKPVLHIFIFDVLTGRDTVWYVKMNKLLREIHSLKNKPLGYLYYRLPEIVGTCTSHVNRQSVQHPFSEIC